MKHERVILERIVLESSDFNKIGLTTYVKLGRDKEYVILRSSEKEYFCHRRGLHEYVVLAVYFRAEEKKLDLEKIRESGI